MNTVERLLEPREIGLKNKILTLTGVSGSGKDYLASKAKEIYPTIFSPPVSTFNLGSEIYKLISSEPKVEGLNNRDSLKKLSNNDIDPYLATALDLLLNRQPALYIAHVVCRQQTSLVMSIESERKVMARKYIFVASEPENIYNWRYAEKSSRTRELESIDDIMLHQKIAQQATFEIAKALGSGYILINNQPGKQNEAVDTLAEEVGSLLD